ncbi:MAG: IS3 family transposase, partial [Clostridia bacterium]|nr:IS3 family transposase [Clostridia bacterium]
RLKELGIIQSMSRKGNCLDNSPTENFFGRLKTEMYYDNEFEYNSLDELKDSIVNYIKYYNKERIVNRLKSSPINYRKNNFNNI